METQELFLCQIVKREYQLVGQCITTNFPSGFPQAAIKIQSEFVERRAEIAGAKNPEILISPYMCNGAVATYFACLEVEELGSVPDGMLGFKLADADYAKIQCTTKSIGEGYSKLFDWIHSNGYKLRNQNSASPLEIYYFSDKEEEDVELLIPVHGV